MSLLLWKGKLTALVAGELDPVEESVVRAHLASCDGCRAHYDALSLQARLLAGKSVTKSQEERELSRLLGALDERPVEALRPVRSRVPVFAALVVAVAFLLVFVVADAVREPEVAYRGGGADGGVRVPVVKLYAKPAEGPLRLVGEFPGSGEAKVRRGELLQPRGVDLEAVDARGAVVTLSVSEALVLTPGRWTLQVPDAGVVGQLEVSE